MELLEAQLAGVKCLTAVMDSGLLSSRPRRWSGRDLVAAGVRKGGPSCSNLEMVSLMQGMGVPCLQPGGGTFKAGYRSDDILQSRPALEQIRAEILAALEEERTGRLRKRRPVAREEKTPEQMIADLDRALQTRLMAEAEEM